MSNTILGKQIIRCDGNPVGLSLGYDQSKSYNDNIEDILKQFGIVGNSPNLSSRVIKKVPRNLVIGTLENSSYILLDDGLKKYSNNNTNDNELLSYVLTIEPPTIIQSDNNFRSIWNSQSFAMHCKTDSEYGDVLRDLSLAFKDCDVVIDNKSHLSYGLGLLIYSKLPDHLK